LLCHRISPQKWITKSKTPADRRAFFKPYLSINTAGFGTLRQTQVAGLHRAVPSTTLDKTVIQLQAVHGLDSKDSIVGIWRIVNANKNFSRKNFFVCTENGKFTPNAGLR
jgi:hypothetical protein